MANNFAHLFGRRFHDTDKRRRGVVIGVESRMLLIQLVTGHRLLIYPDVLARAWIECDEAQG